MQSPQQLEDKLSEPSARLIDYFSTFEGDLIILGAGGKMGPTLARMARRAVEASGKNRQVIAVSRFSNPTSRESLEQCGVTTIAADLLDDSQLANLPLAPHVMYMAGMKFGTQGHQALTWAMNAYLPGRVAEKYKDSQIVVFSTGNVYPLTPIAENGADETMPVGPIGEYAQSCLGRERIFEYFSQKNGTPMLMFRLNYAIDLRYGVLLDIAKTVYAEEPVDLRMGHANVIWQGDANDYALRCLAHCTTPASFLNVTGPELVSIKWLAGKFGEQFGKAVTYVHEPQPTALLNNAAKAHALFGYPRVSLEQMIMWTADWVRSGGEELGKPTHFQEREGKF